MIDGFISLHEPVITTMAPKRLLDSLPLMVTEPAMTLEQLARRRPTMVAFCFDESFGVPNDWRDGLCRSGMLWRTEFHVRNPLTDEVRTYGGSLLAPGLAEAVAEALRRGLGERITGLVCEIVRV